MIERRARRAFSPAPASRIKLDRSESDDCVDRALLLSLATGQDVEVQTVPESEKARRKRTAPAALERMGLKVDRRNDGEHVIVDGGLVDFWPGTGVWIFRESGSRGRGFAPLVDELRAIGRLQACGEGRRRRDQKRRLAAERERA